MQNVSIAFGSLTPNLRHAFFYILDFQTPIEISMNEIKEIICQIYDFH